MTDKNLPEPPEHLSSDDFREHGHALIDWIADYWENVEELPVVSRAAPGAIRDHLPPNAPETGEPFENLIKDLDSVVMPGITHWQHPSWFSFFPANASPPSVLAELVSAGLGVQGMLWSTSPAATEIERPVRDGWGDLWDLPTSWKTTEQGGGVLQMSASDSTHTALVVARHQAAKLEISPDSMVAYASTQTHSSIQKGATVAGYGHITLIDVDEEQAMRPQALRAAIDRDRANGLNPVFAAATVGTTGTTGIDPIRSIGEICRNEDLWLHIDAAYAGNAMLCPEFRHHQDGVELAHSYTFNPHKWLMVNFDCSVFYVADRGPLIDCLSILPPYLKNEASESGAVIDYRDWHVPLGRRFRALKLWWVIRSYGAEGLRSMIRYHVAIAEQLAKRLESDPRFDLVAPHPFALVCFRCPESDEATTRLIEAVNASGEVAWTGSELDGRPMIRVSIGQRATEQRHVDALWALIDELA